MDGRKGASGLALRATGRIIVGMTDRTQVDWLKQIDATTAPTVPLRELLQLTTELFMTMVPPKLVGSAPGIPERFETFLRSTDMLEEQEYGGRLCATVLRHTIHLHARAPELTDDELLDQVRGIIQDIGELPIEDFPPWLLEQHERTPENDLSLDREADVQCALRYLLGIALTGANGFIDGFVKGSGEDMSEYLEERPVTERSF